MQIEIPPIVTIFAPLRDWRKDKGKRYELTSLLQFMVLALLCGKKGIRAMARWGKSLPQRCRHRYQ
jgi:hypothetical protein